MAYKVKSNTPEVTANVKNRAGLAVRFMLDDIQRESEPFTPKRLGNLRADVVKSVRGTQGSIVWAKKYAARQEKNRFKNYTTPGTGPKYAENAVRMVVNQSKMYFIRVGLDGR